MGSIYSITNTVTKAVYIGSTLREAEVRWAVHRKDLRGGYHHCPHLQRSWAKHGETAFVFAIIEGEVAADDILSREQHHIDKRLAGFPRSLTYNVCPVAGNCTGRKFRPESLAKLSESHKGIRRTPESIAKMQATVAAKRQSEFVVIGPDAEEHRGRSLRAFCRTHGLTLASLRKLLSGELRSTKGYRLPNRTKKTFMVTSPEGDKSVVCDLKAFCERNSLPYKLMHKVATGTRKHYHGWMVTKCW